MHWISIVNDYIPNISQAIDIKVSAFGQEDNGFGPVPWKNEYHNWFYLNPDHKEFGNIGGISAQQVGGERIWSFVRNKRMRNKIHFTTREYNGPLLITHENEKQAYESNYAMYF
jgi:hypothetical protein